jgi:hypothetical protein
MASEPRNDKPKASDDRHIFGPRSLSAVLPTLVRPILRKRAPGIASLIADWDAVIGPALAEVTVPRKLAAGTLTIACAGPVAMELQYLAPQLLARINGYMAGSPVARLRFVQDMRPPPPLSPVRVPAVQEAKAAVQGLPVGELRDALESLGRMVLRKR